MTDRTTVIEELYLEHSGLIYDLCVRILHDRSEAEDAVHETFISAYRAFDSFHYGDNYLPWLYRIAVNASLKLIRSRKQDRTQMLEDTGEAPVAEPGPDHIARIDGREALRKLVGDLDERGQQIVVAHFIAGMDQGQVAKMLGISRRAVVMRLTALRKKAERFLLRQA